MATLLSIGTDIRAIRNAKKLSADAVAAQSGIHANTLRAFETGRGNIELNKLLSICDSLGLDILVIPKEIAGMRAEDGKTSSTELFDLIKPLMSPAK